MQHYSPDDGDAETQNVAIFGIRTERLLALLGAPRGARPVLGPQVTVWADWSLCRDTPSGDGEAEVLFVCDSRLHCVDFGSKNG